MKTTTEHGDSIARAMDWLGQLREDGYAEPAFDRGGEQAHMAGPPATVPEPSVPEPLVPEPPVAVPYPLAATPVALVSATDSGTASSERLEIPEPAPIGDELRIPTAWCEMDSCISHYAHPAALGEVDNRSRAIAAGWRIDALGRLACPQCQQGPWFWATQAVARWDRGKAVAMATLMTAVIREDDLYEPGGEAEPTVIPPVEQALVPLPPYDRR